MKQILIYFSILIFSFSSWASNFRLDISDSENTTEIIIYRNLKYVDYEGDKEEAKKYLQSECENKLIEIRNKFQAEDDLRVALIKDACSINPHPRDIGVTGTLFIIH